MRSHNKKTKKFYLHTLGCKVNQYESQAMRESLLGAGFEESDTKEGVDFYILNTCTVTEKADKECRSLARIFHRTDPQARVIVTGCYAEKDADRIASIPGVTDVINNATKSRIVEILTGSRPSDKEKLVRITGFKGHTKAFVKIQDGCENFCTYCKVPLVRGTLKSRPLDDIRSEVEGLVANGFREIVLTGICLGAWGKDLSRSRKDGAFRTEDLSVVSVLTALNGLRGDFRIRLSSIELKYMTDALLDFMANTGKICKHLHIPLQSGDDTILKKMNRPYRTAEFKALVGKIRAIMPKIAITTDVLIGFPGETDEYFRNSVAFLKDIAPARTHVFTYSRRPGTLAYDMPGGVVPSVAKERFSRMGAVARERACVFKQEFIGKTLEVLVESKRDKVSGMLTGYTDNYIDVLFSGPDSIIGSIVPIKIASVDKNNTIGVYNGK